MKIHSTIQLQIRDELSLDNLQFCSSIILNYLFGLFGNNPNDPKFQQPSNLILRAEITY